MTRRAALWRDVPEELWQDWRWQLRNRVRGAEELDAVVPLSEAERRAVAKLAAGGEALERGEARG